MKDTIEAEGSELILRNDNGDVVIIPKRMRAKVRKMLDDECHDCIDGLVANLPVIDSYNSDGSLK